MIKNKFLFPLLLCLSATIVHAQNVKDKVGLEDSHKPNASKGGSGSDIVDVDLFTGTGSVNIPIFACSVDGLSASISVNYLAKGIRVDETSSSVGLGWNLSIGGGITREVNGIEDEVTLPTAYYDTGHTDDSLQGILVAGAKNSSHAPYEDDLERDVFHFTFGGRSLSVIFSRVAGEIKYITYPHSEIKIDIITKDVSHFPGTPASYYNERPGIQSKHGISQDEDVMTFVVTDEKGNKFFFERGNHQWKIFDFTNRPGDNSGQEFTVEYGFYSATNTWDLVRILTYTGKEIKYEYEYKDFNYIESRTEAFYPVGAKLLVTANDQFLEQDPFEIKNNSWSGIKSHIKRITYPDGTIANFDLADNRCDCESDFKLNTIDIVSNINGTNKNHLFYVLNHKYFNTPKYGVSTNIAGSCAEITSAMTSATTAQKNEHVINGMRMNLQSISRITTNQDAITTPNDNEILYEFQYQATPLPYRFHPARDYYGYFNNAAPVPHVRKGTWYPYTWDTIYTSLPYGYNWGGSFSSNPYRLNVDIDSSMSPDGTSKFGVDRSPNVNYMQACILNKIKNGKGGEIRLIYDTPPNVSNPSCSYGNLSNVLVGFNVNTPIGCNIDPQLQGSTAPDGLVLTKVEVVDAFIPYSGGDFKETTEYHYYDGQRFHRGGYMWYPYRWTFSGGYPYGFADTVFTNYFVAPNSYYNGSNHGYSTVVVINKGSYGKTLSKKEYSFSNMMYLDGGVTKSWMSKPTGPGWHTMPGYFKRFRIGLLLATKEYNGNNELLSGSTNNYEYLANTSIPDLSTANANQKSFMGHDWPYLPLDYERAIITSVNVFKNVKNLAGSLVSITSSDSYKYDANDNIVSTTTTDSKGDVYKRYNFYNYNFTIPGSTVSTDDWLAYTQGNSFQFNLGSETWKMVGVDSVMLGCKLIAPTYSTASLDVVPNTFKIRATYSTRLQQPLTSAEVALTGSGKKVDRYEAIRGYTTPGSSLIKETETTLFDVKGTPLEVYDYSKMKYSSALYDSVTMQKIADVENARFEDIAFSSFEGKYYEHSLQATTGNWNIADGIVTSSQAFTGKHSLKLEYSFEITSKPLHNKKYLLTYWSKPGTALEIYTSTGTAYMPDLVNSVDGWNLCTVEIHPQEGEHIRLVGGVPGQNSYIDELRLHPADAMMTSFTYEPLFGLKTKNDPGNYITRYEYGAQGRPYLTKDMRGNILIKTETEYMHPDVAENPGGGGGNNNY